MSELLKKIWKILLDVLIIIIIIIFIIVIYSIFQIKILKKDYPNLFGYTIFRVLTGSMSGSLDIGDIVIVKITDDLQVNDIIVYKQQEYIITHRLIEINKHNLVTKGDANNSKDKPISKNIVIGKVVKKITNVSVWKKVLATPQVLISIIITITLCVLTFLYNTKEKKENE